MTSKEVPWTLKDVSKALWVLIPILLLFFALRLAGRSFLTWLASPFSAAAVIVLFYLGIVALAWFFGPRPYGENLTSLGLRGYKWLKSFLIAAGWLVVLRLFITAYGVLLEAGLGIKPPTGTVEWVPHLFGQSFWGLLIVIILVVVVAPASEEIFFRGFIYPVLKKHWGVRLATALSACIFALFHLNWWLFIPIFSIGVVLAYLYERSGSLLPSILLHSLNNLLSVVSLYYFLR